MDSFYTTTKNNVKQKAKAETKTTNLVIEENNESTQDDLVSNSIINKKKWKCLQCTYENWPSALKCTICLTSKSISISNNNNNPVNYTKLKPVNTNNHGSHRSSTPRANGNHRINKKRNDSSNNRKGGSESKVKLTFESCNEFNSMTRGNNRSSNNLERSWYSSSSSNENLSETNNGDNDSNNSSSNGKAGGFSKAAVMKSKKMNAITNDIYRIGDLLTKNSVDIDIGNDLPTSTPLHQSIETQKWPCQVCTYLNWPKSIKCVQCYTPKREIIVTSTPSIAAQAPSAPAAAAAQLQLTTSNQNINQLSSSSATSLNNFPQMNAESNSVNEQTTTATATRPTKQSAHNKSMAMAATFSSSNSCNELNSSTDIRSLCNSPCTVPKNLHSEQTVSKPCDFSASETTSVTTAAGTTTTGVNLSNDPSETVPDNNNNNLIKSKPNNVNSEPTNSNTPSTTTSNNNDNNNVNSLSNSSSGGKEETEMLKKWSCSSCTYQNWPKSQYCVMCNVQRNINTIKTTQDTVPSSPQINSSTSISNNTNINNNNGNKCNTSTSSASDISANNSKPSKSNSGVVQSVNQRANSKTGCSSKQAAKTSYNLLKTLQIQMDRLFLTACEGVVDGDMTHLHRYINAGGDLTRYLTSDEVKLLNRPNIFTVGLTLLHLCYQFNRKDFLMKILNKQHSLSGGAAKKNNNTVDHPVSTNNYNNTNTASVKQSPFSSHTSSSINLLSALLRKVNTTKFSPCQSCPSLATNIIERYFTASLRQRKTQSRDTSSRSNLDMIGATTNATLCHQTSPTSSRISLSTANQAYMHMSPSPSPPPFSGSGNGAASLSPFVAQCFFVNECHTFILPNDIEEFSPRIQHILFDELLDREVQQELENESRVINWNIDLTNRLHSRLYPLWNRHSGDCLLDSVLQACYGVFDTDNTLRHVMAESLEMYAGYFKPRWKQHEIQMAQSLHYTLDDYQLEQDWNNILALAHQPGSSLEQAHIFALCHIFRRPIIIYSIKYVKSFTGENIGFTHFEGVYLPLIWEPSFCFKNPIALGYTKGHFTALVPLEQTDVVTYVTSHSTSNMGGAVSQLENSEQNNQQLFYLPLANNEGQLLPVHFLNSSELGRERTILRQYLNLDCMILQGNNCGLIVAQQRVSKSGLLVRQMLDEWLSYYRNMQMKEMGQQIEISHENDTRQQKNNASNPNNSSNNSGNGDAANSSSNSNKEENNLEDLVGGDESDDDDEDDDDEDDEEEDYDDEVNNQGV